MTTLERLDEVFVLDLGDGDNRFNATTVGELNECLDEVEAADGPAALVTTATGKIWSNGLDLEFMSTLGDDVLDFVGEVQQLFIRLLRLPVPTIAAVQGHAFAGGAMLALTHDMRVMRADRGYFCLPEIDLGMSFTEGMAALIQAKLAQPARHRLAVLGERVDAKTAVSLGVADAAVELDEVLPTATARARELAPKASAPLVAIRGDFYADVIAALG